MLCVLDVYMRNLCRCLSARLCVCVSVYVCLHQTTVDMRGGHLVIVAAVVDNDECVVVCVIVDALSFFSYIVIRFYAATRCL